MSELMVGAEPFYFPGNDIGCLLIHGFTGAPLEMRGLGEHLAARGHSALGPRLFGHGTSMDDLDRARYHDWIASAEDGYRLLRDNCRLLFVIGLSMGADLTIVLAAQLPVDGVVIMSAPYSLPPDPRVPLAPWLSLVYPRIYKHRDESEAERQLSGHLSYPAYPTRAIAELNKLLAVMRRSLPRVTAPALLIQSRQDESVGVSSDAMAQIYDGLASSDKQMAWLQRSGHVVTRDVEHDRVFELIDRFIDRVAQSGVEQAS
jgi:carboxylesterase